QSRRGLRLAWTLLPIGVVLFVAASAGVITIVAGRSSHFSGGPELLAPLPGSSGSVPSGSPSPSGLPVAGPSATGKPVASAGCAFPVSGGVCPIAPPLAAATGKHWSVSFDEEFSGTALNTAKLRPCFDW